MQCPNCGAEIFKEDKFCGECGHNVSDITQANDASDGTTTETSEHQQSYIQETSAEDQTSSGIDVSSILNEGWSMIKSAFLAPAKLIGSKEYYSSAVSGSVIAVLLLVFSLLAFITMRNATSDATSLYGEPIIPISAFFYTFLYGLLIFAVFFLITLLMNKLIIEASAPWEKVLNDFSLTSIIIISLFIVGVLLNLISLYEIGLFFFAIGGAFFGISPLYIFLRYAENNNTKIDSYYSVAIYVILCAIAYYIIVRIMVAQAASSFFNEFNSFF